MRLQEFLHWSCMAFGHFPGGPYAVIKETWCGEMKLPLDFGKGFGEFLKDLQDKLRVAHSYAKSHTERAQTRYATRYNLCSQDKRFKPGEQVLILHADLTAS